MARGKKGRFSGSSNSGAPLPWPRMIYSTTIDPPIIGIENQPFPEAAQALRSAVPGILERWLTAVPKVLPTAEELTLTQLRDHVPLMLDQIATSLASDPPGPVDRLAEESKPHGEVRFHQAYNINELLVEYHLLRCITIEEVAAKLGRGLSTAETVAISVAFDTVQRSGVVAFVDHLTRQIRASDDLQANYISYLNHDLRGGMNGILLMVEVLKRELSVEPRFAGTKEDLEAMQRSVLDSVATMDRFVFAHRLGRGKQQIRFGAVNVKSLVNETIHGLSHAAKERRIEITVEVAEECPLESDRDLLRLILQNVIGNAIRHSRREGGGVKVEGCPQIGGGCMFTISDDGPGISTAQMGHLFKSSSSSGIGKQGFKLGLPVSKMAADILGATLTVESVQGQGTTVRLKIPDRGTSSGRAHPD